jgi:hypothetical protein
MKDSEKIYIASDNQVFQNDKFPLLLHKKLFIFEKLGCPLASYRFKNRIN